MVEFKKNGVNLSVKMGDKATKNPQKSLLPPIDLENIKNELEETLNEPLPIYHLQSIEEEFGNLSSNYSNEESDANLSQGTEEKLSKNSQEKDTEVLNGSFHLNFADLSLQTPVKPDDKTLIISNKPDGKVLETPQPKIQCTVNMGEYLKTPLPQTQNKLNNRFVTPASIKKLPSLRDVPTIRVKNHEYLMLNQIGKGGSSVVHSCYDFTTQTHCAIKTVSLQDPATAASFLNEIQMLRKLQSCEKIIKMYDYEHNLTEEKLFVVLEVGGPDLSQILKNFATTNRRPPNYLLHFYWLEMLHAVNEIHARGIVHADLKPANFVQAGTGLKLIDFGISCSIQTDMTSVIKSVPEGSLNYISPEALNNQSSANTNSPNYGKHKYKLHYKTDVWSLGCILYQMVYLKTPFQHIKHVWAKLSAIIDPNYQIDYPATEEAPQRILNTIKQCLQYDVKSRPSINELIRNYKNF